MDGTKSPLASMGVWGSIAAIVLALSPVIAPLLGMEPTALTDTITGVLTAVAGVFALIGRLRAKTQIKV